MKKISNQLEAEVCNTFKTSCISQKLLAEKYSLSNASVSRILQRNGLIEPSMARSQKKYRDKLISQNLCTCCAQPALEESRLCLTCWFKRLSSHTWGITSRWIDANGNLTANTLTGTIDLNNILPDGTGIYWGTGSGSLVDTHITTNGGGALGAVSFALNGGTISGSIILALNSGNSLKIDNVGNIISSRILAATSDPHVAGQLYNLSGVVMVSSG